MDIKRCNGDKAPKGQVVNLQLKGSKLIATIEFDLDAQGKVSESGNITQGVAQEKFLIGNTQYKLQALLLQLVQQNVRRLG
jgi:hypothetical protein